MKKALRYQLRRAAGLYWLIDMEQTGAFYNSPVPMNDAGAQIWRMFESGMTEEQVSERISAEYGITPEEAENDVRAFVGQLRSCSIDFGGIE